MAQVKKDAQDVQGDDVRAKDLPADVDYSKSETTKPADPDTGKAMPQVTTADNQRVATTENAVSDNSGSNPVNDNTRKMDESAVIRDYENGAMNYDQIAQKHDVPVERVTALLERHSEARAKKLDAKEKK